MQFCARPNHRPFNVKIRCGDRSVMMLEMIKTAVVCCHCSAFILWKFSFLLFVSAFGWAIVKRISFCINSACKSSHRAFEVIWSAIVMRKTSSCSLPLAPPNVCTSYIQCGNCKRIQLDLLVLWLARSPRNEYEDRDPHRQLNCCILHCNRVPTVFTVRSAAQSDANSWWSMLWIFQSDLFVCVLKCTIHNQPFKSQTSSVFSTFKWN